ncbi:MAG: dihydrodipicolinate synthase family protein [Thaumarchaeota archaeon]|nr:dihydrodipicolinate synthase family protein [Nitrososphaerota archaeon]
MVRSRKQLRGIFPLMPFVLTKNQELDLEGLKSNVKAYEGIGFDGFVAFGCMGEFYASSFEEFKKVVDTAVNASDKVACVFGATFHNTRECLQRAKYAEDAGADGVMIGVPYLIPCTQEAAFEHFQQVNDKVDEIQIMAYNNPASFRFNMDRGFWDRLMKLDRIKAVKESNGDATHRTMVISHISKKINVFSGGENWLLADSLVGANSIVSVCGAGAPSAALTFFNACMKEDLKTAIPLHMQFTDLYDEQTAQNEVAWEKACAEAGGFKAGPPRVPYLPLEKGVRDRLERRLEKIRAMV